MTLDVKSMPRRAAALVSMPVSACGMHSRRPADAGTSRWHRGQRTIEALMHLPDKVRSDEAITDIGLVGDDDDEKARFAEGGNRLPHPGQEAKILQ